MQALEIVSAGLLSLCATVLFIGIVAALAARDERRK